MNTAFASFVAEGLTPPMRETLRRRQEDMFGPPVVAGAGMTLKALRRRGVIEGRAVARVTELGEMVIVAAGLGGEAADGTR